MVFSCVNVWMSTKALGKGISVPELSLLLASIRSCASLYILLIANANTTITWEFVCPLDHL